ncbi:MAG: hypothetical protein ABIQ32_02230 [Sphingomicrobium sp.]
MQWTGRNIVREDYFGAPAHLRNAIEPSPAAQARCDSIVSEARAAPSPSIRRDPPPAPPPPPPTTEVLNLRLAEELEFARRMLDSMGDELSADAAVVMRHSVSLQSVDIIGQILGHIANVVRSSDPPATVDRIGMCELKARLTRKSLY